MKKTSVHLRPAIDNLAGQLLKAYRAANPVELVELLVIEAHVRQFKLSVGRYNFKQLCVRLGSDGHPMTERTARRYCKQIDRIKIGKKWIYTEEGVRRSELRKTLKAR